MGLNVILASLEGDSRMEGFLTKEVTHPSVTSSACHALLSDPALSRVLLSVQGHRVKNWKKRWFILTKNGLLIYFVEKQPMEVAKGHVDIGGYSVEAVDDPKVGWAESDKQRDKDRMIESEAETK